MLFAFAVPLDNSKVEILQWWNPEDWVDGNRSDVFEFNKLTGELTIRQDGLYYVYAQVNNTNSILYEQNDWQTECSKFDLSLKLMSQAAEILTN